MGTSSSAATGVSQLDVVFDGTWVIVPIVDATKNIIGVDIYAPSCGHPQGVTFVNQLNPQPWPTADKFYMLDSHGICLDLQFVSGPRAGMPISGINPQANHCLPKKRPLRGNWDLQVSINAGPDSWTSSDTFAPQVPNSSGTMVRCLTGADAPAGNVSSMQTLSFTNVSSVALCGAPSNVQALIASQSSGAGTIIFEGEVPYIPTLQHERQAIFAMANLGGMDMALEHPLPKGGPKGAAQGGGVVPMSRTGGYCGFTTIVT